MTQARHPGLTAAGAAPSTPTLQQCPGAAVGPADFRGVATALACWYLEFRAGRRCATQVERLVSPVVRQRLRKQAAVRRPAPGVAPVVNALVQRSQEHRVEAVVLARQAERVVAVVVAFGRHRRSEPWLVTELCTPEDDDRTTARAAIAAQADVASGSGDGAVALLELPA